MTGINVRGAKGPEGIDVAAILVVLAGLTLAAWVAYHGPTHPIPMHMSMDGTVDRWGDRREAGLVLAAVSLILGGTHALTAWAVRSKPLAPGARRGLWFSQLIALVACMMVMSLMGSLALGRFEAGADMGRFTRGMGVFLAAIMLIIGGLVGKTTPNPWVGVRTYWSLTSRLAWDKSNRLLGRLWFWLGLAAVPGAFLLPPRHVVVAIVLAMIATGALAVFESWRVWMADPDRRTA